MGVSVLLADDHPVFRQGLRALLEREKFDVSAKRPMDSRRSRRRSVSSRRSS